MVYVASEDEHANVLIKALERNKIEKDVNCLMNAS